MKKSYIDIYLWFRDLIAKRLPHSNLSESHLKHLIGFDKCLGICFNEYFLTKNELAIINYKNFLKFSIFSRGYLVADDAIRDGDIENRFINIYEELKDIFLTQIESIFTEVSEDSKIPDLYISKRLNQLEEVYKEIKNDPVIDYEIIGRKCSFLSLPFDLLKTIFGKEVIKEREKIAYHVLFLLQIADDYTDIEEDIYRNVNSNLFVGGYNKKFSSKKILENRIKIKLYSAILIDQIAKKIMVLAKSCRLENLFNWASFAREYVNYCSDTLSIEELKSIIGSNFPEGLLINSNNIPYSLLSSTDLIENLDLSAESLHLFCTRRALRESLTMEYTNE